MAQCKGRETEEECSVHDRVWATRLEKAYFHTLSNCLLNSSLSLSYKIVAGCILLWKAQP